MGEMTLEEKLLQLVHGFLIDYYVATDRFYNGNLMRVAHGMEAKIREDEPELAAREMHRVLAELLYCIARLQTRARVPSRQRPG